MVYDYCAEMYNDIKEYITFNDIDLSKYENLDEAYDALYDLLFGAEEITGNGENYYASQYACESYLCHNFDLAREACINFCVDARTLLDHLERGDLPEYLDFTIRCDLLGEVLNQVLWEHFNKMNLKCKLTIEWDEGNVDDWIEALLDDGRTSFGALDEIENWVEEQQSDKIKEWAIRNLPGCTTDLNFEWSN